jgi:enamine deaminase RidA (YjgF/YER057c/UK114 family)
LAKHRHRSIFYKSSEKNGSKAKGVKKKMIKRYDINEEWALSGVIEAGNFVFVGYCVGNIGEPIEKQIVGALKQLEERLKLVDLALADVVKMDVLFKNIFDIPIMEKILKETFHGKFPVRKSIQTEFAHSGEVGILFQIDAIAFKG